MEVPFALAMERDRVLPAEGPQLRVHEAGHDRAGVLPGVAARRAISSTRTAKRRCASLVRVYGDGVEGDAAVSKGLGVSIETLQGTFDKMLESRFASIRAALRDTGKPVAGMAQGDLAALKNAGVASAAELPGAAAARRGAGQAGGQGRVRAAREGGGARAGGNRRGQPARDHGRPRGTSRRSRARDARVRGAAGPRRHGNRGGAATVGTGHEGQQREAGRPRQRPDRRARSLRRRHAHSILGRAALRAKDPVVSTREFKVALAIGPADRASAHCDLAEGYLLAESPGGRQARSARRARDRAQLRTGTGHPAQGHRRGPMRPRSIEARRIVAALGALCALASAGRVVRGSRAELDRP